MSSAAPDRRSIIADALRKIDDLTERLEVAEQGETEPIAVVGMGCRFPGAVHSATDYWRLLRDGRSGVVRVPENRWDADAFYSAEQPVPGTIATREGGFLTSWQPDEFDAEFFGMSPREAAGMDPQQRLLLEVTWEALENAGVTAAQIRGSQTAVFVGLTTTDYAFMTHSAQSGPEEVDPYFAFGNATNFAAGRLSYFLGVQGPAVVVDTACSSSLVTIHLGVQSLRRRESDRVIAAGVNLNLSPEGFIACSQWGMLAPDGLCKTFDAAADGYVRSEGCGVVVLRRLSDALRDGDPVLAVVRGSAVNQDGPSSGQTVPSGPAQQAVMRSALAAARVAPSEIDYVEAHGTGTALGDPIELDALSAVFGERGSAAPLVLGSVKTNLGHLESAAGVAGFIKTVLSVRHGVIPRHLHFSELTPHAGVGAAKFTIAAQELEWPAVDRPRRAGVSSFGVSGTNAHVVVEQAPEVPAVAAAVAPVVSTLVVSGKSAARIAATAGVLAEWLEGPGAQVPLADVAYTLAHHRSRFKSVAAVCARDRSQAIAGLQALAAGDSAPGVVDPHPKQFASGRVFVYSGQGSQWAGMARQLLADEPVFAAAIAELEPAFVDHVGFSLQQVLADGEEVSGDARVQPVIMGVQLGLTALWRSYGVEPNAVMGHSMGEITAAVVAGALSPAEGLKVIAIRSRLMSRLAGQGAVALVELDAEATEKLIADYPGVEVTVYSSPRQTVVAGPVEAVDAVIAAVSAQDRFARRVNMEVASHTALMEPILGELAEALSGTTPAQPAIRFISTVTDPDQTPAFDARYWVDNVRQPVRFSQAVATAAERCGTFVEISPHPTMTHALIENLEAAEANAAATVVATLKRDDDETLFFHTQVAALGGGTARADGGARAVLPPTPWQHTRHWIIADNAPRRSGSQPKRGTLLGDHSVLATTPLHHVWQARLAPESKPYPGSHRVHGVELVPVSVLLQTLSTAAAKTGSSTLTDVRFENPIVVDQPRLVQVVTDGELVTISSAQAGDGAGHRWVWHASGRIDRTRTPGERGGAADMPPGADDSEGGLDAAGVADLLGEWGVEGQPFPWSISAHRSIPGGLVAAVEMSEPSVVALLDAAVHVARLADSSNRAMLMPAAVDSITVAAEFADGHDAIEVRRRDAEPGQLVVDIEVRGPAPGAGIDVRGLRFAPADPATASTDPTSLAHAIEWEAWTPESGSAQEPREPGTPGTLAVVGAEGPARVLQDGLAAAGYRPADVDEAQCVVYVADSAAGESDTECAVRLTADVAALVRRLAHRPAGTMLWIVTRGVRECASDAAVRQSSLWGLAGVVRAEQPDIWGGLVDLPEGSDDGIAEIAAALAPVLSAPARSILAVRDGAVSTPVISPILGEPVREPLRCRPDAAYLVTGGLGALSLLMASWLAALGARRLVLAGRTG
ncbi:MAG TPA: beta-ketoacyl synthase N-terminal-like domain-containing protein, partial [Mycobacterium sp.]|nr:beta-ketoacyl synthase N-terminal-like domain-containing protein [Mycobacterium sp.]